MLRLQITKQYHELLFKREIAHRGVPRRVTKTGLVGKVKGLSPLRPPFPPPPSTSKTHTLLSFCMTYGGNEFSNVTRTVVWHPKTLPQSAPDSTISPSGNWSFFIKFQTSYSPPLHHFHKRLVLPWIPLFFWFSSLTYDLMISLQ